MSAPTISIETSVLRAALARVVGVVENRTTLPILGHVHIETAEGGIVIRGTDMDMTVTAHAAASVEGEGAITLPAHRLHDIARALKTSPVKLAPLGAEYRLTSGRSRFDLPTLPAGDFPRPPVIEEGVTFAMPATGLLRLLTKTSIAVSTEETRYYLNGVYLHAHGDRLRAVATDGHRLARTDVDLPEGAADMPAVIVPRKMVATLTKALAGVEAGVEMTVAPGRIAVALPGARIESRLIDGAFPDYERVIPSHNDKILRVDAAELAAAIGLVRLASTEKMRAIRFDVAPGGTVTLTAKSPEGGDAEEVVTALEVPAEPLGIRFNAAYVLDHLSVLTGSEVTLQLADPAAPVVVLDSADADWLGVIMPMRA